MPSRSGARPHRHRSRRRAAGKRSRQSEGPGAAAAPNARPECQRARVLYRGRRRACALRRFVACACIAAGDARFAVDLLTQRAGHPPPGSAACLRHRQYRQRSRAVLSDHPVDRAGRLSKARRWSRCFSRMRLSSVWSAPRPSRSSTAARSWAISSKPRRDRTNCCRPIARTVIQAFADVDNALFPSSRRRSSLGCSATCFRPRGRPSNCPSSSFALELLTS